MKTFGRILAFIVFILFTSPCVTQVTGQANGITLADPAILFYKATYYLYGTVEGNSGNGFLVYTSSDLKSWSIDKTRNQGFALEKKNAFGTKGFWAPQVFMYRKKFYMAYVANENIAIAQSADPKGPFTQTLKQPLDAPVKQIDPFIFIDNDGKKYLYHVRLTSGNKIFVAELTDDFSAIKTETLKECVTATDTWENTRNVNWPVTEGPSVLRHNNLYYLFYSANDFRNPDYAVGYATSTSPYGPWKKFEGNPVLSRKELGINGTGHGDFFIGKGNKRFYVFHTHFSQEQVGPRKTAIVNVRFAKNGKEPDKLMIDTTSFYYLQAGGK